LFDLPVKLSLNNEDEVLPYCMFDFFDWRKSCPG